MNLTRSMLRQLVVVIVVVGLLANVCADTNYMTTDNDSGDLAILSTIAAVPFLDNFEADVLSNVWNVSLSPSGIVCRGSAGVIDNELRLTSHGTSSQCGFAWNSEKQTVVHGFTNTFVFRIDLSYVWQREGFAFVIQNDDLFVGLEEITGGPGYENIENCIAIEFDTYGYGSTDPNSQHIGILTRGTLPASYDHTNALGAVTNLPPLNDGQIHTARVDYVSGSMDVYLDDMSTPILSVSVDLDSTLNLDNGKAWVGFTASAGDQSHNILSWDFTSISNQFSYQSFTNYRGRVAITNLFDPIEGTRHVIMDNYPSSTLPCLNNLDLSIDLSGQSNVWLKYWWKPYGDYTDLPVEYSDESYVGFYEGDGVAASTDNVYWYSMSSLECYNTSSNGYIESYIYLDDYINKLDNDPLGWSSNFCVRFQQYGAGIIPEEGIVLDSVSIYHAPPPVAQFPFEDGFEHGVKHAWWGNRYPLPIKGANYSHSGDFSRGCMNGTTFSDIMTIDLSGQSNVWLSFWCRNQNDNLEYIMPSSFSGDIEADGVSISVDDGSTWYKVQGLTTGEGSPADDSYHLFNINLDLVLSAQGLSFVSNTLIQFEFMQREYHRRYLDDISILSQEFVLSSPTYSAYEGATALIPVIRKGSSSGNVSVDYSTYDQAAAGGSDYAVQNGTLLFGDGVTSLNIEVPIYDDTEYYEPSETFLIAISNATGGAELGSLISATVEIAADPRAPFPFIEGFEFETAFWLTDIPYWRREGRSDGYYVLLGSSEYPHSGGKSLQLRYSGGGATNWGRATVTVNMMEKTNVVLRFWHRTFDQHDAVMPASFIGTNFSDGVAISADGTNWYKASGLTLAEGSSTNYMQHEISLDPILSANGISYNKNFKICFQVYDYSDFEASFVGSVFDDVAVFSVAEKLDVVNVSLPSGTSMVAYATQLIGTNGVPPYTFSTTSTLPQGISLSLDGQLSGLPGDEGTFPVDLQLVDQTDSLTNKVLNLIINANPNRPPVITSTNPLPLVVVMPENTNMSFSIAAIDPEGSNLVYHWSLDENTVGLDSSSYVLNTIWGDAGDYTLKVTVTDGLWQYINVQWNISVLSDNDDDGMPNLWENQYGLDPWHATDATDDPDNDNLVNLQEYHNGTDPLSNDTDGDTLPDGWEVQENMNPISVTNNLPDVRLQLLGSKDYGSFTYDIDIQESFVYMATSDGLICMDISDPQNILGPWQTVTATPFARSVSAEGNYAYMASETEGVFVVDISLSTNPVICGTFDTETGALDVISDYPLLYAATKAGGLQILDVSVATNPVRIAQLTTNSSIYYLTQNDDIIYASGSSRFMTISVSNSAAPRVLGSCASNARKMIMSDNDDYVLAVAGYFGTELINAQNDATPTLVTATEYITFPSIIASDGSVMFVGATDVLSASDGWIYIIRNDDPLNPNTVATNVLASSPAGMVVSSNRLYACLHSGELQVYRIDYDDFDQDGMLDEWELAQWGDLNSLPNDDPDNDGVSNLGEFRAGLNPLDSDSDDDTIPDGVEMQLGGHPGKTESLNQLKHLSTQDTAGSARAVDAVDGGLLYIADEANGLVIMDVSDPLAPVEIGHYQWNLDKAVDVTVQNNLAYFADSTGGVFKVDVSDPANPDGLVRYYDNSIISSIAVDSNLCCYVPENNFSVQFGLVDVAVNVTNETPWRGTLAFSYTVQDVAMADSLAYIVRSTSSSTSVVSVIDISNPNAPSVIFDMDLESDEYYSEIYLDGNRAYVARSSDGLRILDLSTPLSPVLLDSYPALSEAFARDVCSQDDLAFVVYESNKWENCTLYGLEIVDVRSGVSPRLLLQTNAFEYGYSVDVQSNLLFVATGEDGIMIFSYSVLDFDEDRMADAWELKNFGDLSQNGTNDTDGDGISNQAEYEFGMVVTNDDQDADGMLDGWEIMNGFEVGVSDGHFNADGDTFLNAQEYIADTNPNDANDYFCVSAASNLLMWTVYFNSSDNRLYTLLGCSNLVSGTWTNVSGAGPRVGVGGADLMQDTNAAPYRYYRLTVELP